MAPGKKGNLLLPANRLTKPRKDSSQSSKQLSEWEEAEEEYCAKECDLLFRALTQPPDAPLPRPSAATEDPDVIHRNEGLHLNGNEGFFGIDYDEPSTPHYDETDSGTESDDSEQSIASNTELGVVVTPRAGDYNRRRRIREVQQWEQILESMFKVFMRCKLLTFDWSQSETWNVDTKIQCRCSVAKKRIRHLELVDILTHDTQAVEFCSCQSDQVRLIQMGYIGGSPDQPEIAFSLRLLRLHDALWRYCCVRTHPFALALDFFHRVALGFVEDVTQKPRRWGRSFSCAVDAYRRLIQVKEDLGFRAMELSTKDKLGANCPRCFGENIYVKKEGEPDYVVCVDGNFQQRRHKSASVEVSEIELRYPHLFLHPTQVNKWKDVHSSASNDSPDPCTQMHTAANDSRSSSTWRACDDTGLLAMVCRHDHALAFVNVVQSGEKSYFAHALLDWLLKQLDETDSKVALLYDIGCNLEKGLVKHNLFEEERRRGRFKFGTSVFHAYVHSWSCQLDYNPRLNHGWGLSDGEGCERCWCKLCKLVAALRYATKQHRFDAVDLKAAHENEILRTNSAASSRHKLEITQKTRSEKLQILADLESKRGYDHNYFAGQWARQKLVQAEVMGDTNVKKLHETLEELIEHEEELREAKEKETSLRSLRRRRTINENRTLASLPGNIAFLEEEIERIILDLGGDDFRDIPEASDEIGRLLIQIRVAKTNLYEAKVGIVELGKKWEAGTSLQQRMKVLMNTKQAIFRKKWKTYHDLIAKYNTSYPTETPLINYTHDEVKSLSLEDTFWNFGHLTHPDENWAVDADTQRGIQAYLVYCRCEEELRRIAHEVRQMFMWSLATDAKIRNVLTLSESGWDPTANALPIKLVTSSHASHIITKTTWEECTETVESVYHGVFLDHARVIFAWDTHLVSLLRETRQYSEATVAEDDLLEAQWKDMLRRKLER